MTRSNKTETVNELLEEVVQLKEKMEEIRNRFVDINMSNFVTKNRIKILNNLPKLICIHLLRAHHSRIHDVRWSPKGDHLLSVGSDNSLIIWDAIRGLIYNLVDCSSQQPITADISEDLDNLFVGGLCANVTLFTQKHEKNELYESYVIKSTYEHQSNVSNIRCFKNELLTTDEAEFINYWDVEKVKIKQSISNRSTITSLEIVNPLGVILTGGSDGLIKLWDRRAKNALQSVYDGHESDVTCLSIASNLKTFFSGSDDTFFHMYDIRLDTPLARYGAPVWRDVDMTKEAIEHGDRPQPASVASLAVSPSARIIFAGCRDNNIYVWDACNPADPIKSYDEQGPVTRMLFNENKSGMAIVTWDLKNRLRIMRPQK